MAQEIKKPEPASTPAPVDPFGAMRSEMDRVFDNFLGRRWGALPSIFGEGNGRMASPSVDIRENENEIVVETELPGLEEKDVSVTMRDGVLTIKGEKKSEREEKKDDYHVTERSFGSFQRAFRVPDSVDEDKIVASLEKGVLHVTLPKKADAQKPEKKIPIGG